MDRYEARRCAMVQGIFGVGGERNGIIRSRMILKSRNLLFVRNASLKKQSAGSLYLSRLLFHALRQLCFVSFQFLGNNRISNSKNLCG